MKKMEIGRGRDALERARDNYAGRSCIEDLISGFDRTKTCKFTHLLSYFAVADMNAGCLKIHLLRGRLFKRTNARHAPQRNEL
jgi:hypothetical protein